MFQFKALIQKFGRHGEKSGWTYIIIPAKLAGQIKSGNKKGFRVKGCLDNLEIERTAVLPMGDGDFILPINAGMRKATGKEEGDILQVSLQEDPRQVEIDEELLLCLADEPEVLAFFEQFSPSHQRYFSKWIQEAKTMETKTKRIAKAVMALQRKMNFSEMMREGK